MAAVVLWHDARAIARRDLGVGLDDRLAHELVGGCPARRLGEVVETRADVPVRGCGRELVATAAPRGREDLLAVRRTGEAGGRAGPPIFARPAPPPPPARGG